MRRDTKPQPEIVENLGLLNSGRLFAQMQEKLCAMNLACLETGGKGKIVLTVNVEHAGGNKVMVTPELKITDPLPPKKTSTFFVLDDGRATRNDPDQIELDFTALRGEEN